jgi:hypothetical protein
MKLFSWISQSLSTNMYILAGLLILVFFFKKNLKLVDEVQKIVLYYSLKHAFK